MSLVPSITGDNLYGEEARLVLSALILAVALRPYGEVLFRGVEKQFRRLARRRVVSLVFVGLLALGTRAALLPRLPIPVPSVADEFSYLLQADTFAHGRLTNPTPSFFQHFETFHVILLPTYASKYPPLQGFILSVGQVLFGHPWFGVWLSMGVLCATLCWMLRGWLPPSWALLGGFLAILRLGSFSYWVNSYWGGAGAAIGGALVLGALPRIVRKRSERDAWLMGLGLFLLANSRPYEGFVLGLAVALALVCTLGKRGWRSRDLPRKVLVPLGISVALVGAFVAYYNWRVTGDPLLMPYQVYEREYDIPPTFIWQKANPDPPLLTNVTMRRFEKWSELPQYQAAQSFRGFLRENISKIEVAGSFFLGPALTLPLLAVPWIFRDHRIRPLLWIGLFTLAGFLPEVYFYPHYAAPILALIYLLLLQCMRHMRIWRIGKRPFGKSLVRYLLIVCLITYGLRFSKGPSWMWTWYSNWPGNITRARIADKLEKTPGRQIVFVHYSFRHNPNEEWVYNGADLKSAKVLWARDISYKSDQQLINHYPGARAWLVEPDHDPVELIPFPRERAFYRIDQSTGRFRGKVTSTTTGCSSPLPDRLQDGRLSLTSTLPARAS